MGYSVIKSLVIKPKDLYIKLTSTVANITPETKDVGEKTYPNEMLFNMDVEGLIKDIFTGILQLTSANQYKWYARKVAIKEYVLNINPTLNSYDLDGIYDALKILMQDDNHLQAIRDLFLYGTKEEQENKAKGKDFHALMYVVDKEGNATTGIKFNVTGIRQSNRMLTSIQTGLAIEKLTYAKAVYIKDRIENEFVDTKGQGRKVEIMDY